MIPPSSPRPTCARHHALSTLLKDFGVPHIQLFSDGAEAWEWRKDNPEPGLIIYERRLPGLPGPLLVQRIRSHEFAQVPIVVVSSLIKAVEVPSGYPTDHLAKDLVSGKRAFVLPKPFTADALRRKVREVLDSLITGAA